MSICLSYIDVPPALVLQDIARRNLMLLTCTRLLLRRIYGADGQIDRDNIPRNVAEYHTLKRQGASFGQKSLTSVNHTVCSLII